MKKLVIIGVLLLSAALIAQTRLPEAYIDNILIDGNEISSTNTNGDITISPNGTGSVVIDTDLDVDNININGNTISTTNTNGNLTLTPNGVGSVFVGTTFGVGNLDFDTNTISGTADVNISAGMINSVFIEPELAVDNLLFNGNTISSTNTNGDLIFDSNGSGLVYFLDGVKLQAANTLSFADADSSDAVGIKAPATVSTNYTLTLPTAQGSSGQSLINDGSGNLSWGASGGGGGISNAEYNFIIAGDGNSQFETDVNGVTGSTTSPTHNTTTEIEGEGSLSWDPTGAETLRWDAVSVPAWAYGTNCYAEIYYTGGGTDYSLKVLDGSNVEITSSGGVTTDTNAFKALSGTTAIAYRTFVCPSSGSVKLSLETGSDEAAIIVDRAYIGQNFRLSSGAVIGKPVSYTPVFTGWGTVTDIEFVYTQIGGFIQINGRFTAGTVPGSTEKRISLPNGMTTANSTILGATLKVVGNIIYNFNSSSSGYMLAEPSVTYLTMGVQDITQSALTKYTGTLTTGSIYSINALVPIAELQEQSTIYTPPPVAELTNEFSASINGSGAQDPAPITNQNVSWLSVCDRLSLGDWDCDFNAGQFSVAPNCFVNMNTSGTSANRCKTHSTTANDTQVKCSTDSGTEVDVPFTLMCQRGEGDYSVKQSTAPLLVNSVVTGFAGVAKIAVGELNCDTASAILSNPMDAIASISNRSSTFCTFNLTSGYFPEKPWFCGVTKNSAASYTFCYCTTATNCNLLNSSSSNFDAGVFIIGPK